MIIKSSDQPSRVDKIAAEAAFNEPLPATLDRWQSESAQLERADGVKFYMQYFDYPPAAAQESPLKLLDGLKNGRIVKGKVRFEQRFELDGNWAQREIVDWEFGSRPVIVAFDVLRGLRLYSVFCIVERDQEALPEVKAFFDSFAMLPL